MDYGGVLAQSPGSGSASPSILNVRTSNNGTSPSASYPENLADVESQHIAHPAELKGLLREAAAESEKLASNGDRNLLSPQLIEMHTFRDALDVNYQRMALTGEELSGVSLRNSLIYI
jgi:hypothetical protein